MSKELEKAIDRHMSAGRFAGHAPIRLPEYSAVDWQAIWERHTFREGAKWLLAEAEKLAEDHDGPDDFRVIAAVRIDDLKALIEG